MRKKIPAAIKVFETLEITHVILPARYSEQSGKWHLLPAIEMNSEYEDGRIGFRMSNGKTAYALVKEDGIRCWIHEEEAEKAA